MARAVAEYRIVGIRTTLPLFARVLRDPAFRKGDFDTSFLATLADAPKSRARRETAAIAAAICALRDQQRHVPASGAAPSSWWQAGVREGHRGRA